jgi:hypothetical protein
LARVACQDITAHPVLLVLIAGLQKSSNYGSKISTSSGASHHLPLQGKGLSLALAVVRSNREYRNQYSDRDISIF